MKLIGIALTPSLNLTTSRAVEALAKEMGVAVGPLNGSNNRTRFQVLAEGEVGYEFLQKLVELEDRRYRVELLPALDVHR